MTESEDLALQHIGASSKQDESYSISAEDLGVGPVYKAFYVEFGPKDGDKIYWLEIYQSAIYKLSEVSVAPAK